MRVRRFVQQLGVFLGDAEQRLGEGVERFFALGFGRLDHDRFGHRQREVDRRGVEAVVEQPLGEVHRRDAALGLELRAAGDELVHAAIALRHGQEVLHAAEQVVGVEHRVLADAPQAVRAVRADVAVGPQQHADVAEEGADAADGLGAVVVEASSGRGRGRGRRSLSDLCPLASDLSLTTIGAGKYGASVSVTQIGPAPGPPPPCGPLKVLCGL